MIIITNILQNKKKYAYKITGSFPSISYRVFSALCYIMICFCFDLQNKAYLSYSYKNPSLFIQRPTSSFILHFNIYHSKRKRTRSDSVLWRKPLYEQKIQQHIYNTKTPPKPSMTTIANQPQTVSWSNNSHPTGMVKPVYGYPTFPLTTTTV